MRSFQHVLLLRVRYSETDQMGTFYNSRALEWFECGRSELMRAMGMPYSSLEAKGAFLPVVVAHVEYLGRAQYDDLLEMTTVAAFEGRARLRCEVKIVKSEGKAPVAQGYTIHAFTNREGKAIRPPEWFASSFGRVGTEVAAPAISD